MRRFRFAVVTALAVFLASACQLETNTSIRSGTVNDPYVEEPLTEGARKYERALQVSNQVLDRMAARDYQRIYRENLEPSLQAQLDQATFLSMLQQVETAAGPIVAYKRMQWAFDRGSENGQDTLTSTKIVQHRKAWVSYRFVFRDDGRYASLAGFHYSAKK